MATPPNFYLMTPDDDGNHFRAEILQSSDKSPTLARWTMGRAAGRLDLILTTSLDILLSESLVLQLTRLQLTGWASSDCKVLDWSGKPLPENFHLLQVTGRCGAIDYERATRIDKRYAGGVFRDWRGFYFDPATWDGSDLFKAEGTEFVFASLAAANVLTASSLHFVDSTSAERDWSKDQNGNMISSPRVGD